MAVTKKITMQGDVFEGISSVFALANGLPDGLDVSSANLQEFPVSDDSGFNFDTGQPSIEHFKVKGLNTDWVNTFTPGDGEMTLVVSTAQPQVSPFRAVSPLVAQPQLASPILSLRRQSILVCSS